MRQPPPFHIVRNDADAVRGVELREGTLRRVWTFARPYRRTIAVFLGAILAAALVALVPVFVVRRIIDVAIPDGNKGQVVLLAAIAVAAAVADAGLAVLQRCPVDSPPSTAASQKKDKEPDYSCIVLGELAMVRSPSFLFVSPSNKPKRWWEETASSRTSLK